MTLTFKRPFAAAQDCLLLGNVRFHHLSPQFCSLHQCACLHQHTWYATVYFALYCHCRPWSLLAKLLCTETLRSGTSPFPASSPQESRGGSDSCFKCYPARSVLGHMITAAAELEEKHARQDDGAATGQAMDWGKWQVRTGCWAPPCQFATSFNPLPK